PRARTSASRGAPRRRELVVRHPGDAAAPARGPRTAPASARGARHGPAPGGAFSRLRRRPPCRRRHPPWHGTPFASGLTQRELKERDPEIQLVLMSAYSSVADAVEAIKLGASDYVEKPIDFRRLERVLQTLFEKRQLQHKTRILEQRLQGCVTFEGIVARSP